MIPEYFMCEAERRDNGEVIKGYYLPRKWSFRKEENIKNVIIVPKGQYGLTDLFIEIKPETLRRVTVRAKVNTNECPNCKSGVKFDNYCPYCGMAIDWN